MAQRARSGREPRFTTAEPEEVMLQKVLKEVVQSDAGLAVIGLIEQTLDETGRSLDVEDMQRDVDSCNPRIHQLLRSMVESILDSAGTFNVDQQSMEEQRAVHLDYSSDMCLDKIAPVNKLGNFPN